jgi:hypothetical protein
MQDADYHVPSAALAFGALSGVIAGFAVTAIVLLAQAASGSFCQRGQSFIGRFAKHCVSEAARFVDRSAVAFLFAVFGCTVAAIELIGAGAERESSRRNMAISICARAGFVVSIAALFWGLAVVAALAFGEPAVDFASVLVVSWAVAVLPVLGFVYFQAESGNKRWRFVALVSLGAVALLASSVVRIATGSVLATSSNTGIDLVFGLGVAIVLAGMLGVLLYGSKGPDHAMGAGPAGGFVLACSVFVAGLIYTLP